MLIFHFKYFCRDPEEVNGITDIDELAEPDVISKTNG